MQMAEFCSSKHIKGAEELRPVHQLTMSPRLLQHLTSLLPSGIDTESDSVAPIGMQAEGDPDWLSEFAAIFAHVMLRFRRYVPSSLF